MSKDLVILIDVWNNILDRHIWNMIKRINKLAEEDKIEAALFATYCEPNIRKNSNFEYHNWIRNKLNIYSEELVPENYIGKKPNYSYGKLTPAIKNQILLLEKSFNFNNIIMMGGNWKECVHYRPLGINNLKKVLPHKKIIIYPDCMMGLYDNIKLVEKGPFYG